VLLPVVALVITGLALFAIIWADRGAYQATKAGYHSATDPNDSLRRGKVAEVRRYEKVRRQLATAVPAGSTIVIDPAAGALWLQRVAEFAVMSGIHITVNATEAEFQVSVLPGIKGGAPRVLVERLP
jgi:hypothetical protein